MTNKLIHIAQIQVSKTGKTLLLLREQTPQNYIWYMETSDHKSENETPIRGDSVEEAIQAAHRHWRLDSFRTIICGFRYTLPERDECGMNALFHQMIASQNSFNGIYFDENLGHNCYVKNASQESLTLYGRLKNQQRL